MVLCHYSWCMSCLLEWSMLWLVSMMWCGVMPLFLIHVTIDWIMLDVVKLCMCVDVYSCIYKRCFPLLDITNCRVSLFWISQMVVLSLLELKSLSGQWRCCSSLNLTNPYGGGDILESFALACSHCIRVFACLCICISEFVMYICMLLSVSNPCCMGWSSPPADERVLG